MKHKLLLLLAGVIFCLSLAFQPNAVYADEPDTPVEVVTKPTQPDPVPPESYPPVRDPIDG